MTCSQCDKIYNSTAGICPHCGYNAELSEKMCGFSNILYNKGLSQAKSGDLSGAIEALSRSVSFNKDNIQARNLLGLVYYAAGLVGDALKQWVLSIASNGGDNEDNPANSYLDEFKLNPRRLEKYADSLRMYNLALNYLKQKSEDMAIIQLKKAIEYNAHFVDAMNLLALCYMMTKQRGKALGLVDKVLEIDAANAIAMSYLRELNAGKVRRPAAKAAAKEKKTHAPFAVLNESRGLSRFPLTQLVSFLVGAAITAVVMHLTIMSASTQKTEDVISVIETDFTAKENELNDRINSLISDIETLSDENETLKETVAELTYKTELQNRITSVYTAKTYFEANRYFDTLSIVDKFNETDMPQETIDLARTLKEDSYKILGEDYYEKGRVSYNAADYSQARIHLRDSLRYELPSSTHVGDANYLLGRIAEFDGDIDTALSYFRNVADNYPDAYFYDRAVNKINELSR